MHFDCPHFIFEDTEAQEFPAKVTQLERGSAKIETQAVWLQSTITKCCETSLLPHVMLVINQALHFVTYLSCALRILFNNAF